MREENPMSALHLQKLENWSLVGRQGKRAKFPRRTIGTALAAASAGILTLATVLVGMEPAAAAAEISPPDTLFIASQENGGTVVSMPTIGGATTTLVTGMQEVPIGLAVSDDTLYVADRTTVRSVPTTGGTPTTVITGLNDPNGANGVAVAGNTLYIPKGTSVVSVPTSGGTLTTLATILASPPYEAYGAVPMTVAVVGDTVYFTVQGYGVGDTGTVRSVPITGGTPTTLVAGLANPFGLAVSGDTLYFSEPGRQRVSSVPITGGTPTTLVTDLHFPIGLAVSGGTLYIADAGNAANTGAVLSVPTTGGTPTPLVSGLNNPMAVAVQPAQPTTTPPCAGSLCSLFGSS